ncbi:hypothetical protein EJD97_003868, partial [Solanum chilense]
TVRRWQHSATAEGRWGSLIKCGVTESMTVRRVYEGLSCRFVMIFREVVPVPIFQEFKCFETKTLDGPLCLWRSVILSSRVMKRVAKEIAQVWDDGVHDGPS